MKKQNLLNTPILGVLCTVMALAVTPVAQAALLSYTGTVQIDTTTAAGEIDLNNVFDFSFTYVDAITDVEVTSNFGNFPNAITAFSFWRVSGTGTWNPAGTMLLPADVLVSEGIFVIEITAGTPLGTEPNSSIELVFAGGYAGIGQTINEQIGGPLSSDINDFGFTEVGFGGTNTFGTITAFSATVVPVPAAVWLFGSGLIGLIGLAKRKASL